MARRFIKASTGILGLTGTGFLNPSRSAEYDQYPQPDYSTLSASHSHTAKGQIISMRMPQRGLGLLETKYKVIKRILTSDTKLEDLVMEVETGNKYHMETTGPGEHRIIKSVN